LRWYIHILLVCSSWCWGSAIRLVRPTVALDRRKLMAFASAAFAHQLEPSTGTLGRFAHKFLLALLPHAPIGDGRRLNSHACLGTMKSKQTWSQILGLKLQIYSGYQRTAYML
jgi:hypothetical protein